MICPRRPCSTCPYVRTTPPGVWAASEYEKLPMYEANETFAVFLCHQGNVTGQETVCRGWLSVERESIAARLVEMNGEVPPGARYEDLGVPLYETGTEAALVGLEAVGDPSPDAKKAVDRLRRRWDGWRFS